MYIYSSFFTQDGLSMTEKIKKGMKVEINDPLHPYKLWVATVRNNIKINHPKKVLYVKLKNII